MGGALLSLQIGLVNEKTQETFKTEVQFYQLIKYLIFLFRNNQDRQARLKRNFFLTAEEAHAFDPTYVVRESIYK